MPWPFVSASASSAVPAVPAPVTATVALGRPALARFRTAVGPLPPPGAPGPGSAAASGQPLAGAVQCAHPSRPGLGPHWLRLRAHWQRECQRDLCITPPQGHGARRRGQIGRPRPQPIPWHSRSADVLSAVRIIKIQATFVQGKVELYRPTGNDAIGTLEMRVAGAKVSRSLRLRTYCAQSEGARKRFSSTKPISSFGEPSGGNGSSTYVTIIVSDRSSIGS